MQRVKPTEVREERLRSVQEAYDELQRELDVRLRIYDKWVSDGRLSWSDAVDRIARLKSALLHIGKLCSGESHEEQPGNVTPITPPSIKETAVA